MDQLDRLVRMRKENYLNDSEFSAAKEKLLGLGQISELPNAVVFLPSGEAPDVRSVNLAADDELQVDFDFR